MSYIRFTTSDFRTISDHCKRQDLGKTHQAAFKRLLVAALGDDSPELADRITGLGRERINLLFWHFRERLLPAGVHNSDAAMLTEEEWQTLSEACMSAAFPVRFIRQSKAYLVEFFRQSRPTLARKVHCLSGQQFKLLYHEALERGRGMY